MIRQYSAGGVVYKKEGEETLWLLIRPNIEEVRWHLPKGWIDPGEKSETTAVREVKEEGGVEAQPITKAGSFQIFFKETLGEQKGEIILKTVTFYLMKWLKDLPEGHDEEVAEVIWLPFLEAKNKLTFKNEKEILEKAKDLLEKNFAQTSLF